MCRLWIRTGPELGQSVNCVVTPEVLCVQPWRTQVEESWNFRTVEDSGDSSDTLLPGVEGLRRLPLRQGLLEAGGPSDCVTAAGPVSGALLK